MRAAEAAKFNRSVFHLDLVDSGELKHNRILAVNDVVSGLFKRAIEE